MLLINVNTEGKVNKCVNKKKIMVEISRFLRLLQWVYPNLSTFFEMSRLNFPYLEVQLPLIVPFDPYRSKILPKF